MNVLIYEEYDYAIHGNQKYICLLLEYFGQLQKNSAHLGLIVPTKRDLFSMASKRGDVCSLSNVRWWLRPLILLKKLAVNRPDIILCNNERALLFIALGALLLRIPIVWYVKNFRKCLWTDFLCFLLASRILAIAPKCIHIKFSWLQQIFKKKIHILSIGIQPSQFIDIPLPESHNDLLRILLLGNVSKKRGIDVAIQAIEKLDRDSVNVHLRVAGVTLSSHQQFAQKMKQQSKALHHSRVEWLGWRDDIPQLLAWSDIVILPSRSEGVPRSLSEAMAAGRPVIATAVGGIPNLITEGETGFLIPNGDADALADRIMRLAADNDLRLQMGKNGRKYAVDNLCFDKHFEQLMGHLLETIQKARS